MSSFNVFYELLRKDFLSFWKVFPGKLFDVCFLFLTNVVVFGYFMPHLGLGVSYGPFLAIGAIAIFGFFEVVGKISLLMSDIDGAQNISHSLIFPIYPRWIFCQMALSWALMSSLLTLLLFPFGKVLLWETLSFQNVSWFKLIPIFIIVNLFYGFFALWITSILNSFSTITSLYLRVINPLFMFGAYFYSWKSTFALSSTVGYLSLLNPVVYCMEGLRGAFFGQEEYLSYWVCLFALLGAILFCAADGTRRLRRRLDCL